MTCGYCGLALDPQLRAQACDACVLAGGCSRIRCPRCGYETPEEPRWIKKLRAWKESWNDRRPHP